MLIFLDEVHPPLWAARLPPGASRAAARAASERSAPSRRQAGQLSLLGRPLSGTAAP
jgi:hypothetical protein